MAHLRLEVWASSLQALCKVPLLEQWVGHRAMAGLGEECRQQRTRPDPPSLWVYLKSRKQYGHLAWRQIY